MDTFFRGRHILSGQYERYFHQGKQLKLKNSCQWRLKLLFPPQKFLEPLPPAGKDSGLTSLGNNTALSHSNNVNDDDDDDPHYFYNYNIIIVSGTIIK